MTTITEMLVQNLRASDWSETLAAILITEDPEFAGFNEVYSQETLPLEAEIRCHRENESKIVATLQKLILQWSHFLLQGQKGLDFSYLIFNDVANLLGSFKRDCRSPMAYWQVLQWISSIEECRLTKMQKVHLATTLLEPLAEDPRYDLDEEWFAQCLVSEDALWVTLYAFDNFPDMLFTLRQIFEAQQGKGRIAPDAVFPEPAILQW